MPDAGGPAEFRPVFVVGPAQLGRHSVEEAVEAGERLAARRRVVHRAAPVPYAQASEAVYEAQMELDAHYVEGVGAAWGAGDASLPPPAPRNMDLAAFAAEAAAAEAAVVLCLSDSLLASGELQRLLDDAGVGYTGVGADFALRAGNRLAVARSVDKIAEELNAAAAAAAGAGAADGSSSDVGLAPVARKYVKAVELIERVLEAPSDADAAFEDLLEGWGGATSVAIRAPMPAGAGAVGTTSAARIASGLDLLTFCKALDDSLPRIPRGLLSQSPLPVTLPVFMPEVLVVQPWVETDAVELGPDGGVARWPGEHRWVEVSIGLLGELGAMTALPPTLVARTADGTRHQLTPAPATVLPPDAAEPALELALALADGMGLRSAAAIDGFVNVDTGDLLVLDVHAAPSLADGSPLLQQALAADPPQLPHQLFRSLARGALLAGRATRAANNDGDGRGAGGGGLAAASDMYAPPGSSGGFTADDFGGVGGVGAAGDDDEDDELLGVGGGGGGGGGVADL